MTSADRNGRDHVLTRGERVGRYVVDREVGAGGMGVVYEAHDPELDRRIAVKVMRGGGDDADLRARLLREAKALARLAHPNVVAVHDVGLTEQDDVFVAMEYVDGETLRAWLTSQPRSREEIIEVLVCAGRGIAAAHGAGLIHRDFKPDNVMIGADGRVRVLDFGLARQQLDLEPETPATDTDSGELSAELTGVGARLGTPAYMAPEQHRGAEVDPRTDQFSFCVTAYEALYGERPFGDPDSSPVAHRRAVLRGQVRAPPDGVDVPARVRRVLVTGLAADPDQRYPSMKSLLDELAPADQDRRWRWVGGVVAGVAAATIVAVVYASKSSAEPDICTSGADRVAEVWNASARERLRAAFVSSKRAYAGDAFERVASRLDTIGAQWALRRNRTCRAAYVYGDAWGPSFERVQECLDARLSELSASLAETIERPGLKSIDALTSWVLGLGDGGECADTTIRDRPTGATASRVAELRKRIVAARARQRAGKYREALELAKAIASDTRGVGFPLVRAEALRLLGDLQVLSGDAKSAEATLNRAVSVAAGARSDRLVAEIWIAQVHIVGYAQHRFEDGVRLAEQARREIERHGSNARLESDLAASLASMYYRHGDRKIALEHDRRALALREKVLPREHPLLAKTLANLGSSLRSMGKYDEAQAVLERALTMRERLFGAGHPLVANVLNTLGNVYTHSGQLERGVESFNKAIAIRREVFGEDSPRLYPNHVNLATAYRRMGRFDQADQHITRGLALLEKRVGPDHPKLIAVLNAKGNLQMRRGRHAEAEAAYSRALAIVNAKLGKRHSHAGLLLGGIGNARFSLKRYDGAAEAYRRALEVRAAREGAKGIGLVPALNGLGSVARARGRCAEARRHFDRALRILEAREQSTHHYAGDTLTGLGRCASMEGRSERAVELLRRALAVREKARSITSTALTRFALAQAMWSAKQDRKRALNLAEQARTEARAVDPELHDQIEAWLEKRGR